MFTRTLLAFVVTTVCGATVRAGDEKKDVPAKFAKTMMSAVRLISEKHFTPATESQLVVWSIRGLYDAVNEELPLEIRDRLVMAKKASRDDLLRLLRDARARLGERKALEGNKDVEACIKAIFAQLEPAVTPTESAFIPGERTTGPCFPELRQGITGVGLKLEADAATGMLRVLTPLFGGPAYHAGIRAGDLITHMRVQKEKDDPIAQSPPISTKGMTVERANQLLRGPNGTRVVLTVIPASPAKVKNP